MRVVVIGATGHIGSYLVPDLVRAGHDVVAISRGTREPYHDDTAWQRVERVTADRDAEDRDGSFGRRVADLRADAVVDLVCFTPESATVLVEALRGTGSFLVHCGTIWVHGPGTTVPVGEDDARDAFGDYGTGKAAIERLLLTESRAGGLPSTVLHPGHISGPGWDVINPAGNLDPDVWRRLAAGEEVLLPHLGLETLHHVHAADVAQAFALALAHPDRAVGESFHVVSPAALTLRGYAEAAASWFGQRPRLTFVPWEEFAEHSGPEHAGATWEHIARSPSASIDRARARLGYAPAYTSLQTTREAVAWLAAQQRFEIAPEADRSLQTFDTSRAVQ
ncbi:MAG: NAD-dependent epimerase/dehydratase family protein [Nocardioidaceae bacterium]|nr:NAD-dependent epimerase/dehydratase family protein [Nocardioidaceae bacterium]NUS52214.1 NAD-dependent epimerase/dehydratase family protein [Nocardioidaceae bacterium]